MGFDDRIRNEEIFDPRRTISPFQTNEKEYPSEKITTIIRLSNERYISSVRNSLHESQQDFVIEVRGTNLTVSGYPPAADYDEDTVLAIARKHDPRAQKIQTPGRSQM